MTTNPSSTPKAMTNKKIKNKTKSPQVAAEEHDIVDIHSKNTS
jgi:hypothetical protein